MAGQKMELGPTAKTVAANITRIRKLRGLNYTDLSRKLDELGRAISALSVRRIEDGARRVDVDDLMAFAVALDASPVALLSPDLPEKDSSATVTGVEQIEAGDLWDWMRSDPRIRKYDSIDDWFDFQYSSPEWRRVQLGEGIKRLVALNEAEEKAAEGDSSEFDRLLAEYRKIDVDD